MFTKSQLDRMIGTLTSKIPKTSNFVYRDELTTKKQTLPKKLQRSPKIIGYRDESLEVFSNLKEPLLLPTQGCKDTEDHEQEISCCNKLSITSTNNSNNNTNSNIRVKVLMTKKEAAMLLSKCKEEGTLEFKDVITELGRLPAQRINVVSVAVAPCQGNGWALATIPEED